MASKTNTLENGWLALLFNNTALAQVGDTSGLQPSAVRGSLYLTLHTADPGEGGNQSTSEATFGGYARQAITRIASGWTVTGNQVSNTQTLTYTTCTSGTETLTHFGIGTAAAGAGTLLYSGPLGTSVLGPFTAQTNDNITIPGLSGLAIDDRIAFYPAYGSSLPTGISEGTLYWVKSVASSIVTISTTQGGSTLDITVEGDGLAIKAQVLAMTTGVTPQISAGSLVITED